MKASVIHEYGGPEVLRYEDYPDPLLQPDEVLVRVAAAGVNPIDTLLRSGQVKERDPVQFPGVLGWDVSGTVEEVGAGVEGLSIGDQVLAWADQHLRRTLRGESRTPREGSEGHEPRGRCRSSARHYDGQPAHFGRGRCQTGSDAAGFGRCRQRGPLGGLCCPRIAAPWSSPGF
jgi:hypothetical protein